MKIVRICPCCSNDEAEQLFDVGFVNNNCLPSKYNIVSCDKCGFTFANSDANQSVYDNYYKGFNIYATDTDVKIGGQDLSGTSYEKVFDGIKKIISKKELIIDLGCGNGSLLSILQDNGYANLCGLDPSEDAIERLKKRGINGCLSNIFYPVNAEDRNKYDVVLSTCVIEHIFDLYNYIEQMKLYLKDNTSKIVLSCPAVEGFSEHITARANYFNQEHINYFSIESLDNLMRTHGLKRINDNTYFYQNGEKFILAVYVKSDEKEEIIKDTVSKKTILSYLDQLEIKNRALNRNLDIIEKRSENVVVFGAGQFISQILFERPKFIDKIDCFIDNNPEKQKRTIMGKRVYPVSELLNKSGKLIVICSMLNSEDIERQIIEMGCKNEIMKLVVD